MGGKKKKNFFFLPPGSGVFLGGGKNFKKSDALALETAQGWVMIISGVRQPNACRLHSQPEGRNHAASLADAAVC